MIVDVYQFGQEDVGKDTEKNNNTGSDEVSKCCILKFRSTYREEEEESMDGGS